MINTKTSATDLLLNYMNTNSRQYQNHHEKLDVDVWLEWLTRMLRPDIR